MAQPVTMLNAMLQGQTGPVSPRQFRALQTAAAFDGRFDPAERAVFQGLQARNQLGSAQKMQADQLLKTAPNSPIENPEVSFVRAQNPTGFDAQVQALKNLAKPGDRLLWQSTEGFSAHLLKDPISHASLVLPNGMYMDTMDLEGASILNAEALVAKNIRRGKSPSVVIATPQVPLSSTQLQKVDQAARNLQGRGYSMLAPVEDARFGSCAGTIYETFRQAGIDAAPVEQRSLKHIVKPSDLMLTTYPVAMIDSQGAIHTKLPFDWKPGGSPRSEKVLAAVEKLASKASLLWNLLIKSEQQNLLKAHRL